MRAAQSALAGAGLRAALEHVKDGIFFVDSRGLVFDANAAACLQLARRREELVGAPVAEFVGREGFVFERVIARLETEPFLSYQSSHLNAEGQRVEVEVTITRERVDESFIYIGIARDVTERTRVEEELRQSEQRYRLLVENLPKSAIIVFDRSFRFVLVDGPEVGRTGFSPPSMIGRTPVECLPAELASVIMPNMRAVLDGQRFSAEVPFGELRYSYEYVPLRDSKGFVVNGLILAQNVTEQYRATLAMTQSERQFRTLTENLPDIVARLDREHRYVYANPVFQPATGMPFSAAHGKTHEELGMRGEQLERWSSTIERVLAQNEPARIEDQFRSPTGIRTWDARLVPEPGDSGDIESVLVISRDVTERRAREEELRLKNEELTRFTYTVSHDLKSPLVTIQSFLGFLVEDAKLGDQARVERDVSFIKSAADRMAALLADLLQLSRVGRQKNPPEKLMLDDLLREALTMVAGQLARISVELVLPKTPVSLWGDRLRLVEVFQNLLDNAIKFSAGAERPRIEIACTEVGGELSLSVADNGMGIDPRHAHKLFGLFEKLHPEVEGTGIGLALVKRIVDVHGGRIWIDSEGPGRGTKVSFTVPGTRREDARE